MRQVVLDTETTGLDPGQGHRIIEIGGVELVDRRFTSRRFHRYLQPDREIEAGAEAVHGITAEFLRDRPRFAEVAGELLEFLRGAELVIHNAAFDVAFLDHELALLPDPPGRVADFCTVLDTLELARRLHPGQRNSLDALCKRYEVDASRRDRHGALLDAELLAQVYLAMTGGQTSLALDVDDHGAPGAPSGSAGSGPRPALRVVRARADERAEHERVLAALEAASGAEALWRRLGPRAPGDEPPGR